MQKKKDDTRHTDNEKDIQSSEHKNISSEDIDNAHAAGAGALGRSEENLLSKEDNTPQQEAEKEQY